MADYGEQVGHVIGCAVGGAVIGGAATAAGVWLYNQVTPPTAQKLDLATAALTGAFAGASTGVILDYL